jgi:hypothetical protein
MNPVDAAATLAEYLSTWARKKFVLVPKGRLAEKRKNQTKAPVAATVAVSNGDASDSRGDLSQTLPIAAADNDSRQAVDRIIQKYFTATGPSTSNVTSVTSAVGQIGKPDAVCGLQPCLDQCENSDDQVCRNDVSASMLTTQVDDQRRIDFGDSFASSYDVATLSPYGHPHPLVGGSNWRYRCYRCPYVSRNRNDYLYHQQFHYQLPLAGAGASKRERRDNWSPGSWMSSEHRRLAHSPAVSLADERPSTAGLGISIRPPCSQTLMIAPTTTTRRHFVIDSRPAIEATASERAVKQYKASAAPPMERLHPETEVQSVPKWMVSRRYRRLSRDAVHSCSPDFGCHLYRLRVRIALPPRLLRTEARRHSTSRIRRIKSLDGRGPPELRRDRTYAVRSRRPRTERRGGSDVRRGSVTGARTPPTSDLS